MNMKLPPSLDWGTSSIHHYKLVELQSIYLLETPSLSLNWYEIEFGSLDNLLRKKHKNAAMVAH